MYNVLANIVYAIHIVVLVFMPGGLLLPKRWKRIKIYHAFFCILVFILQVIYGFKCPLTILELRLRELGDPNYTATCTPFTERLFMKMFGISISGNIVFIIIALLAVLGTAQILTMKVMKKGD